MQSGTNSHLTARTTIAFDGKIDFDIDRLLDELALKSRPRKGAPCVQTHLHYTAIDGIKGRNEQLKYTALRRPSDPLVIRPSNQIISSVEASVIPSAEGQRYDCAWSSNSYTSVCCPLSRLNLQTPLIILCLKVCEFLKV
jgi:hypothetical protein